MSLLQTSIYKFVLDLYCTEACLTGFRGARRDENMRMPDVQPMHADAEHGNQDPCQEDEEFFESRPDAATMEEAIGKFMDRFVWTRSDSVQTCFILNMNWYILVHTIF
jgi:hypothetical protein